ncbi:hypothetical protein ECANGB1_1909 [Enterospora canceri]|uniref:Uncharacterized protein n=1 Tax=Enterospora canceri TaxID=1081671 RepID=A0A1Y1S9P5_9MICR|nr:hypothetical protein ECANGB1_1909 [Enterospora canceri]
MLLVPTVKFKKIQTKVANAVAFTFFVEYVFMKNIEDGYILFHPLIIGGIAIFNIFSGHGDVTGICGASFLSGLIALLTVKQAEYVAFGSGMAIGLLAAYYATKKERIGLYNTTVFTIMEMACLYSSTSMKLASFSKMGTTTMITMVLGGIGLNLYLSQYSKEMKVTEPEEFDEL